MIALQIQATSCKETRILVTVRVENQSDTPVIIGELNLSNVKFRTEQEDSHASPWISTHTPNSDGVKVIEAWQFLDYEVNALEYYYFPCAGVYKVWAIYNTLGFQARFAGAEEMYKGLDTVGEYRMHSDSISLTLSQQDIEYNRVHIRKLEAIHNDLSVRPSIPNSLLALIFVWLVGLLLTCCAYIWMN